MLDAEEKEHGLRIFSQEYCLELFPARWQKSSKIISLLWDRIAVGFEKALASLHADNYFAAKFIGQHNFDSSTVPFNLEGRNLALPIACWYDPDENKPFGFKVDPGRELKLLRQSSILEQFKLTCEKLGYGSTWPQAAPSLSDFLTTFYADRFLWIHADQENGKVLRSAFTTEDVSVDLTIRLSKGGKK